MGSSKAFSSVLEALPVACFAIDAEHRVVQWNRACEILTGRPAHEMLGTSDHWRPFYAAKRPIMADLVLLGAIEQQVDQLYHGKFRPSPVIPGTFEAEDWFPLLGDDGRWLYFTAVPLRDEAGLVTGAICTLQDITKRRRAEEAVKARTHRLALLQTALDTADDAVVLTDTDGAVIWCNSAFSRLTGYSEDEARGQSMRMLKSGKQDAAVYRQLWQTIQSGRVWRGELINRRRDGSLYPEDQTITPVIDAEGSGEITHFVAVKRDATARKQAEQDARSATLVAYERLRGEILALFSSSHDPQLILSGTLSLLARALGCPALAVYLYDEWYGVLRCEATCGAALGMPNELALGESLVGQVAQEQRMLSSAASAATPFANQAWPIVYQERMAGVLVLASAEPLPEADREFVGSLCIELGVALHSVRQFEDLKALSEQLKERGQEITRKNAQLELANRLKREFLANMSHELRTPLNAVIGFSEVLRDELLGTLNDKQRDYVGEIFDSGNHLLSLINDILDLSKIEAGKMELAIEPVNVAELLRNSLSIVKEKAAAHAIRLYNEVADEVGIFSVDGRKLRQVVYNLLSNAVKFTPNGGEVRLVAFCDDGTLCIEVRDTGIGIAEEDLLRLFRPFEQLDGSLSRQQEGTGLGLAMVKSLVEMHGGTVRVSSALGQGSCFCIVLPILDEEAAAPPVPDPVPTLSDESAYRPAADRIAAFRAAVPAGGRPSALVVEDDQRQAELLRLYLEDAGYETRHAANGALALDEMALRAPEVIVLDLLMPDMDGYAFLDAKSGSPQWREIPVVVVSSAGELAGERQGGEPLLAAEALLCKPVKRGELLRTLAQLVPIDQAGERRPRVLVVDDDPKAIKIVASYLAGSDYELIVANGGAEGLALAQDEVPDILILDLMMPGMNGFEVLAALKDDELTRNIPVLILSARILTRQEREYLEARVSAVAEKGQLHPDDLRGLIERAVGKQKK